MQLGRMGEANARRLAPAPEARPTSPYGPSPMNPMAGSVGVPLPIQSSADPGEVERGVQAGAGTAAVTGTAIAAAPIVRSLAKAVGTGAVVDYAAEKGLQKVGVPEPIAEIAGTAAGVATGGGVARPKKVLSFIKFLMRFSGKKGLKKGAEKAAKKAVTGAVGNAMEEATQIANKIRQLKQAQKLSDPQVVNALRELYGIAAKDAREMIKLVTGG